VRVAVVDADALYPHARPRGVTEDDPAVHGYRVFRERCIRCHAINREGGKVGPELNVPQSIVAYRPEAQIRAYIRDPLTFRYGSMPANPDLREEDLDALLAYFRVMATQPHDPETEAKP
jgi:mono/diheme cytochrome c family protein